MIFGRPRSLSAAEKLLDLRSQVGDLVVDQAAPAASHVAAAGSRLLQQAVALLPIATQYGDVLAGVFRWARNRAADAAPAAAAAAAPYRGRSRWKSRLRHYAVAAAALGAGYAVYHLTRTRRRS